jgi:hypothetical protein
LNHWQQDSVPARIRDRTARVQLPTEEQKAWTQLWADVAALLEKEAAVGQGQDEPPPQP